MVTRREAWAVYSKAFAVSLALYLANLLAERQFARVLQDRVLCWASAFATVQTAVIILLSVSLLLWRTYARLKENLHEQMRPAIRDRVLALAFEGESWSSPVPPNGPARQVLEESIAHTLTTVKAAGRDRVARFAIEHGFAAEWANALRSDSKAERRRAVALLGLISPVAGNAALFAGLDDGQSGVRAEAYRALLVAGEALSVEQVFRSLLEDSLLMRALLADDLKRHAAYLLAHTIPPLLERATPREAARCFEILISWKRALPSFDVRHWVDRQDDSLAPLLLALLPYVLTDESTDEYVSAALESTDIYLRIAGAAAAGRLQLTRPLPGLESPLGHA